MDLYENNDDAIPIDQFTAFSLGEIYNTKLLLDISVHARNVSGWTVLMYACSGAHHLSVRHLIAVGAQTGVKGGIGNKTPLMLAAGTGDLNTVKAVCSYDDLELTDNRGWTALFYAVFCGREVCTEYLLDQGAQINQIDHSGRTPALLAVKSGIESLIAIFVKRGADFGVMSNEMESAATVGAGSRSPQIQTMVSKTGAFSPIFKSPFKFRTRQSLTYSPNKITDPSNKENVAGKILFPPKPPKNEKQGSLTVLSPLSYNKRHIHPAFNKSRAQAIINNPTSTSRIENLVSTIPLVEEVEQLLPFLKQLKLEKYWPIFRDEEVDFETLLTFDDVNLLEVGIKLYGPRKKILAAIQEYKSKNSNGPGILQGFTKTA